MARTRIAQSDRTRCAARFRRDGEGLDWTGGNHHRCRNTAAYVVGLELATCENHVSDALDESCPRFTNHTVPVVCMVFRKGN